MNTKTTNQTNTFKDIFLKSLAGLMMLMGLMLLCPVAAFAADPSSISFTIEGCRNDGTISLPNGSGKFICANSDYTTGNLGKGWNELDLVPFRITAKAGTSAPTTQTYTISIVLDSIDAGKPGYDVISVPVLNTALSSASCQAPQVTSQMTLSPGFGGIDTSIYRLVTITQLKNTTCVYDYYGRLALGSHLFPGSSLHANIGNENLTTSGIGAKDVSIPVKEISPQELSKDMTAEQALDYVWNVVKTGLPASISFGDVCETNNPQPKNVSITVTWSQLPATPGSITAVANIYATNPASRTITVSVIDAIYQGSTQSSLLDQQSFAGVDVPANTKLLVATHSVTLPATSGNINDFLNDIASATYTDLATGIPVPGQTTAMAQAQIKQGSITNPTATIEDEESITGNGLTFSVAAPSIGSFSNYLAGTSTVGPVNWNSGTQTGNGSVIFAKTLNLDGKRITSGVLTDTANLFGSDGFTASTGAVDVDISSDASVKLTLNKIIPSILSNGEKMDITFHITRATDNTYSLDKTFSFVGGGATSQSIDITGLVPDSYTVTETSCIFYDAANVAHNPCGLVPTQDQQTVNLSADSYGNISNCSGSASFSNVIAQNSFAKAQVQKITDPIIGSSDPDYTWSFALAGPVSANVQAGANNGYVDFGVQLLEGTYTVTETLKSKWIEDSAIPNNGSNTKVCTFTVDYPSDFGKTFSCTFHNTKVGNAKVIKTVSGQVPSGNQAFTFQLRQDATPTAAGTILESLIASATNGGIVTFSTDLIPGSTYQICEVISAGWLSNLGTFVPDSFNPDADNSIVCANFTVTAGELKTFSINNSPPPGGRALTIGYWKNWASCATSKGKQKFTLDQTLASFAIAAGQTTPGVYIGKLYVDTCIEATRILNKSDVSSGKKMSSDPLYNLAAQLLAADLNLKSGAYTCPAVVNAINSANALLNKYNFNGTGSYANKMSASDKNLANSLATFLDNYNNDRPGVCGL